MRGGQNEDVDVANGGERDIFLRFDREIQCALFSLLSVRPRSLKQFILSCICTIS